MCYVVESAFIMQTFVIAQDNCCWADGVLFKFCKEIITYVELWILCM